MPDGGTAKERLNQVYLVTPLPSCAILFDRHVHKNGGTSVRSIIHENDLRDDWVYWGYGLHQHRTISQLVMRAVLNGSNCAHWPAQRQPLRMAVEYHYARNPLTQLLSTFGPGSRLQTVGAQCACRIVLVTRLREPLSFYTSFYRWTVDWRQKKNASLFGASMLEWAPRNLQSSVRKDNQHTHGARRSFLCWRAAKPGSWATAAELTPLTPT